MKIPTLINSSSKINGELIFTTDVRIDGEVFGKVESDKSVIIGAEGYVKGFLRAKDLVIFGRFEGNIVVSGLTTLHENASVFGNLYTRTFEVKDGAVITARVVMYDKLEAIDEAQIYLAEEMIKTEPNRRQAPVPENVKISFDDAVDSLNEDKVKIASSLKDQALQELVFGDSGDVLSRIMENKNSSDDLIIYKHKDDLSVTDESLSLSSAVYSSEEITGDNYSEVILAENQTADMNDPNQITNELNSTETSVTPMLSDSTSEMDQADDASGQELEEEIDKFTLLSASDELNGDQQDVPETSLKQGGIITESDTNHILEFDFEDSYVDNGELILFPLPNPVSIAGCLGEPVMEDSSLFKKGKKKPIRAENTIIPQVARKNKGGHSISGFEELRNLLIPVKYQQMKMAEKKSDQEKFNLKKNNDSDAGIRSKESEKSELFLNNAIRQLPDDDYSSLFN